MVKILTSPVQGDVPFGGHKATGLADPTSAQDASTKAYVDAVAQGLSVKASVRAASTANIASQSGLLTVDGVTLVDGDRVLAKDQTTGSTNGIWVAHSGAWTRAADADAAGELVGAFVFVEEGATNAGSGWVQTAAAPITVGTTSLTWTQFSGAGQIVAGAGLAKAGNTLRRAASATGYANLAALPSAAANNGLLERTADGGIYESDGSAWQPVRDPSGTYAAAGSASSALANIYRTLTRATEDANVLVLGTSIEDETTEWPYLMTAAVAALFPAWTVKYQAATVDGSALINGYAAATTIQTGTNGRTLNVWNAAHTGYQALSILGQGGDTALACGGIDSADAVFISMGMNETATDVDARGRYTALLEKVMDRHPRAGIVSILQNPNNNNTNQAIVNRIISEIAASYSVPTVDVYDAFLNSGATWAADLLKVDGVHPNAAGSQVYLAEVMKAWTAAATARPDSGSRSRRPYGENLFTNPRFTKLDGSNVPIGWTASNATASKDTTNFETGTYAVRLVNGGSAAQSYVYFDLPLALCKGRWMTAIVRLRINGALAATVGRLSIEDGVTTVTQQASAAYGGGAFLNATISKLVDPAATRCRVKLYLDTGTGGTLGDITIDRATAFRGVGFHDSIDPEVDGKPDSLVFPTATVFTSGGTYTVPAGVAAVEVIAVGGGSGGGGGGTGNAAQVGGGGGGSGAQAHAVVTVTAGQVLTVAVGAGGAGGAGGAAGSNPGSNGSAGGDTTVTGTGVSVTGQGSNIGGKGALAGSTTLQPGGMYGQNFSQTTNAIAPGQGGSSGARGTSSFGYSGGSGAGGAAASGGNGGNGGAAGGAYAKGAASPSGTTGAVNAGNGSDAAANSGAGGGGGGGSQTGIGGTGGAGGSGFAIVRPVG